MKHLLTVLLVGLMVPLSPLAAAEPADRAEYVASSEVFQQVRGFCDLVLEHGRDRYGPRKLSIFVNGFDIDRRTLDTRSPSPIQTRGHRHDACNLQLQASLLRLLWHMSEITGDPKYRQEVVASLRDYFEHVAHPETGCFPWGTHCAYLVETDTITTTTEGTLTPVEEKFTDFPWEILYEVDPQATLRMIDHFRLCYNADMTTWFHHRDIDATAMRRPEDEFNIRAIGGNHPYTISAVTHMKAWAFAYNRTRNPKYLDWTRRILDLYQDSLDEQVGLITEIANVHRLRQVPVTRNQWVLRSLEVAHGDPYLWGYFMHKVADLLGPEAGRPFLESGREQLRRWPRAAWDEAAGRYKTRFAIYPFADEGHRREPQHLGFWEVRDRQGHHQPVTALLTYSHLYRRTGDRDYRRVAEHLQSVYVDRERFIEGELPEYALLLAVYLQGLAELYEASQDESHREMGRMALGICFRDFFRNGFFLGRRRTALCSHGFGSDDLAVAVLRWDMTDRGLSCPIEDAYLYDWGYSFPANFPDN